MKHLVLSLSLALAAAAGCSKTNDLPALEQDALSIAKYYQPRLDAMRDRLMAVLQQSGRVPKNLPGSDDATRALVDARDKLAELDNLRKNIEKQAPALARDGKLAELEKMVEDEDLRYREGTAFVHENLSQVESWLTNAIRATQAAQAGYQAQQAAGSAAPAPSPADVPATAVP